jgi:4-amino-4-deoxy-L-arabinose transferase-like glycosyltransferase
VSSVGQSDPASIDVSAAERDTAVAIALVAALVTVRLLIAAFTPLAYDETYYWLWSKHLAGGYLDHPPMVALIVRLGTAMAGDTPLGIRLAAVLLAVPATWAVWRSAAILIPDRRIAPTAAVYFNLTLMVAAGTVIVTPDAPLLVAAAFGLFFLAKVKQTGFGPWWLAVGAAAGFGCLSKYTALFFGASIFLWLLLDPPHRRWFLSPWSYLGGIIALVLFTPVIAWNATNEWASFDKQFGRARVEGLTLRFLGEHLAAQFGLATPSIAILGIMGYWAFARGGGAERSTRVLLQALFWPLTIYFLWHSLHSRVEGNWTGPLFPAFVITAAVAAHSVAWTGWWAQLARLSRRFAVPVGLALTAGVYLQAAFGVIPFGRADPTARQLGVGLPVLAAEIDAIRRREGAAVVLTEMYGATGWLSFYLPGRSPVVQFHERIRWTQEPLPDPALFHGTVLYVCQVPCIFPLDVQRRWTEFDEIASLPRTRHGVVIDTWAVYRLRGLVGAPIER